MLLKLMGELGMLMEPADENNESLESIIGKVQKEIELAEDMFNLAEDEDLLDAATYKLKSLTIYREFLLKTLRAEQQQARIAAENNTTVALNREEGYIMG